MVEQFQIDDLVALAGDAVVENIKGSYIPIKRIIEKLPEHIGRQASELSADDWGEILEQLDKSALEAGMIKEYLAPPIVPFLQRGEYYCLPLIKPKRTAQFIHEGSQDMEAFNLIPNDLPIHKLYGQDKTPTDETIVWVKLFAPGHWTWFVTEYDPEDNLAFGYVMGFENEWGYISIGEMDEMNSSWKSSPMGLSRTFVERDLHFKPITFGDLKWSVLEKDSDE